MLHASDMVEGMRGDVLFHIMMTHTYRNSNMYQYC